MFDFLCYQPTESYLPKQGPVSFARILNASPVSRRVDVHSNGYLIGRNLGYKKLTPYFTVPSGNHNINIFPAGKKTNLITYKNFTLEPNCIYTLTVTESSSTGLFLVPDLKIARKEGYANIRFINLYYPDTSIDVNLIGQGPIFYETGFQDTTDYLPLPSEKYTFQFKLSDSGGQLITLPNIVLKEEWNYTIYAMGLADKKPGLQLLNLLDGNTYIDNAQ